VQVYGMLTENRNARSKQLNNQGWLPSYESPLSNDSKQTEIELLKTDDHCCQKESRAALDSSTGLSIGQHNYSTVPSCNWNVTT